MIPVASPDARDPALCDFLLALHSDETALCRTPAEPDPGQRVVLRLRTQGAADCRPFLRLEDVSIPMDRVRESRWFSWYEAEITCGDAPLSYCFLVEWEGRRIAVQKHGAHLCGGDAPPDARFHFRIAPGFHTPAWAQGAVQYQILTDRFRDGDPANNVADGEYRYAGGMVRRIADWNAPPTGEDYRHFYGGDLLGVIQKLDYIQSLGVEAIYFNPLFLAPSSHKYDTQDYARIDPHFGVIEEDEARPLGEADAGNAHARQYIRRVTAAANLEKSNELFARLCREIHRRGMRIILDGVFNHCGSFHRWMDREGIYAAAGEPVPGAYQSPDSPFRSFFAYRGERADSYESWWGFETLPKLNYDASPALCETIWELACRWARPPYSIDGWRLDVAADLGHSRDFNHRFWREFRRRLKAVNPDILILAEHYGDPEPWLRGDQWDSVMNYDAFMEPVTYFLTGMEKHSDAFRGDLYQNGEWFFACMLENMSRYHWASLQCAMNELSNHDHSRFLTRTNRTVGRLHNAGAHAAGTGIDPRVFREAVVIQMTWPGAPTIYYGDEAGQVGWTDPDCRRTYPWGREDRSLIHLHRTLTQLRRDRPVLRGGALKPLGAGRGWIAYGRFDDADCAVVACNNNDEAQTLTLPLRAVGAEEGDRFLCAFRTEAAGDPSALSGPVRDGRMRLTLPPRCAAILLRSYPSR